MQFIPLKIVSWYRVLGGSASEIPLNRNRRTIMTVSKDSFACEFILTLLMILLFFEKVNLLNCKGSFELITGFIAENTRAAGGLFFVKKHIVPFLKIFFITRLNVRSTGKIRKCRIQFAEDAQTRCLFMRFDQKRNNLL